MKKYNLEKIKIQLDEKISAINNEYGRQVHSIKLENNILSHFIIIKDRDGKEALRSLEYSITPDRFIDGEITQYNFETYYFKLEKE